jgi:hypothetical protein
MHALPHPDARTARVTRSALYVLVLGGLGALGAACGSNAPTPPRLATLPSASVRVTPTAPAEDRSKAAAPAGLVLRLHVDNPWSAGAALGGYAPSTFAKVNVGKLAELVVGSPALLRHVDFHRPFDLAIAAQPATRRGRPKADLAWAFAFDPVDLEADVEGEFTLERLPGGVRRLVAHRAPRTGTYASSGWHHDCVVAPAIGPSPYRLVCTTQHEPGAVERLTPWLARGVTAESAAGEPIRATIDLDAIRASYRVAYDEARDELETWAGSRVHTGRDETDRIAKRLGRRVAGDLFDFLDDTSSLEIWADPRTDALALTGSFKLATANAWTSKLLLASADAPGGPRAEHRGVFLPEAHSGGFARGSKAMAPLEKTLEDGAQELLDAVAADLKWSPKDKAAYATLATRLALGSVDRAWIDLKGASSTGKPTPAPSTAPDARRSGRDDSFETAIRNTFTPGITLSVEERPAKETIQAARDLGALLARPSTSQALKSLTDGALTIDAKVAPEPTTGLPAGSFAQRLSLTVSMADAGAVRAGWPQKIELVQLVVPDGDRTWTAWARRTPTADAIAALARARKGGTPPSLALRPLLEPEGAAGAFSTLRALVNAVTHETEVVDFLAKLPNSGADPLIGRAAATRDGSGGSARFTLFLPRDVIAATGLGTQMAMRWIF